MPGVIRYSRLPTRPAPLDSRTGPDPSFLDTLNTAARQPDEDALAEAHKEAAQREANDRLIELLGSTGVTDPRYRRQVWWRDVPVYDEEALWSGVTAARQRNPRAFAALPATLEEYRAQTAAPFDQEIATRGDKVARGNSVARFTGSLASGASDPINLALMGLGIGEAKTFGQAVLREAALNAKTTAILQPVLAAERVKQGRELTATEVVTNVAEGALIGGVFGGAVKGGSIVAPRALEAILPSILPRLPERLRAKYAERTRIGGGEISGGIDPADLPDIAEAAVGRPNMTADEQAAAIVVRREGEIDAANPYQPTGAGIAAHREGLADAMRRILSDVPDVQPRVGLRDGTALGSGAITGGAARDAVKSRIAVVESANGTRWANPRSSARGKYQFLNDTWLAYFRRRFGSGGLSDEAILAKRADAGLQDVLMNDLLADNAAFLQRQGAPETAGNLYLVHFAGQGGARRILEAEPGARVADLLGSRAVRDNPFLRDMTASDLRAWADRRMGGRGDGGAPIAAGGEASAAGAAITEAPQRASAGETIAAAIEEPAPIAGAQPEAVRFDQPEGTPDAPVMFDGDPLPQPRIDYDPARPPNDAEIEAAVRAYIDNTRESVQPRNVADRLGIDRARADAALAKIARDGGGLTQRGEGRYARDRGGAPTDLLKFIAEHGGIRNDEGHDLIATGLPRIAPSGGVLIRKGGMSLDRARELAVEAGYFHSVVEADGAMSSTSVADMIDLLHGATDAPHFARGDIQAGVDWQVQRERSAAFAQARGMLDQHIADQGIALHPTESVRAAEMMTRDGIDAEQAVARIANGHLQDVLDALAEARDKAGYGDLADSFERTLAEVSGRGDAGIDRPVDTARPAGGSGAGGEEFRDRPQSDAERVADERAGLDRHPVSPLDYEAFSDPTGAGAQSLRDSLLHDLRALVDPAVADRQRQQTALGAASPLRAATDQESTIGLGLFDATDQGRLGLDKPGAAQEIRALIDEIDGEQAAINAVRGCL